MNNAVTTQATINAGIGDTESPDNHDWPSFTGFIAGKASVPPNCE